jgi:amidophosphoribosyltransferase
MVRAAGARKCRADQLPSAAISPCFYGVDTPRQSELIAPYDREIRDYLEADSVAYLSLEGLLSAVGSERTSYCSSCYTGRYPVQIPCDEAGYLQLTLKMDKSEPVTK